ncbi:hypothetical protein QTG54_005757 [Skeletonema marinoi]|uniref:Uncharacterized protein n=1 Tax=Skeletonema marinoi TaxID=267567 RepID=A0AAD8YAZ8_9STRA|nr:hypothetical protein QTG54_005757 [Skeletonema marinoi]|mmetsp:Transcript_21304/g.36366  ORF Transcript_21304/g.36366 Transcript_21304/m.36366 type:complete len:306 (-) Transcript_21304:40-957(-)
MMMVKTSLTAALLSVAVIVDQSQAFVPPRTTSIAIEGHASSHETCLLNQRRNDDDGEAILSNQRRHVLQSTAALALAGFSSLPAFADEVAEAVTAPPVVVPMKSFVDNAKPSLFSLDVPQRFFSIRRSAKGDLPDEKTGKGRRGGTIFTAGDMAKAEVIAVERFPVKAMLEDEGYQPSGDLTTIAALGDPVAVATLLIRRREKDKPGTQNSAVLDRNSVVVSPDTKTMTFTFRQEINVQKPELLLEEIGVSELFRTTVAKATLSSNDGQMMAAFASALDQDFNGPDGVALQKAIDSFIATDQATS